MNAHMQSGFATATSTRIKMDHAALEPEIDDAARLARAMLFAVMGLRATGCAPSDDDLAAIERLAEAVSNHCTKADETYHSGFGGGVAP